MDAASLRRIETLRDDGALAEAMRLCRATARRQPDSAAARLLLADLQMRAGDAPAAHRSAVQAARLGAGASELLRVLAPAAIAVGDRNAAGQCMAQFERVPADRRPALLWYWSERLEDLYRFEQAATMLKPLADHPAADYRTLVHCAQLWLKAHKAEAAAPLLERAIGLDAGHPAARLAAMRLAIQTGDPDRARDQALQVLERDPESLAALSMLAEIDAGAVPEAGIAFLRRCVEDPSTAAEVRAAAGLALGRVDERAGDFGQAFAAFAAGNRALKALAGKRGLDYDREAVARDVEQLEAVFGDAFASSESQHGSGLVFIVGMPRSGTTLIDRVLAAHPQAISIGESPAMPALARQIGMFSAPPAEIAARLSADPDRLRAQYLGQLPVAPSAGQRVVDKLPLNFWNVGLIRCLFPGAVVLHARRNPLDIALSSFRLRFPETFRYVNDFSDFAHYFAAHCRLMDFWRARFGSWLRQFDYDAAVTDFEPAVRQLLADCGLDWNDACLEFHRHAGAVYTLSQGQVHRPLYRTASGRWQRYADELQPLITELAGYGIDCRPQS